MEKNYPINMNIPGAHLNGQRDRQTDGQGKTNIPPPPNFVCGGIKMRRKPKSLKFHNTTAFLNMI